MQIVEKTLNLQEQHFKCVSTAYLQKRELKPRGPPCHMKSLQRRPEIIKGIF